MIITDTHAHLEGEEYDNDRAAVVERAQKAEVGLIVNMGIDMASSARSVALVDEFAPVWTGVGIHPEELITMTQAEDDQLAAWTENPKVIAIGEIGLDYYWEKDPERRLEQQKMLIRQLDLARQLHLPVCIHDREAHGDMMKILRTEGRGIGGVIHCFSGSWEMAQELLRLGWYLGVDGPLTWKNAAKLPEIVQKIPADRLLVETDSPYLTPVPMRGHRNEPAFVRHVAEFAAGLRGVTLEEFAARTTQNAIDVYGLKR